jgi:hypothetical protein
MVMAAWNGKQKSPLRNSYFRREIHGSLATPPPMLLEHDADGAGSTGTATDSDGRTNVEVAGVAAPADGTVGAAGADGATGVAAATGAAADWKCVLLKVQAKHAADMLQQADKLSNQQKSHTKPAIANSSTTGGDRGGEGDCKGVGGGDGDSDSKDDGGVAVAVGAGGVGGGQRALNCNTPSAPTASTTTHPPTASTTTHPPPSLLHAPPLPEDEDDHSNFHTRLKRVKHKLDEAQCFYHGRRLLARGTILWDSRLLLACI